MEEQILSADIEHKKGKGCLFYGCLTVIILFVLFGGLAGYGLWKLKDSALGYTETEPLMFEKESVTPERLDQIMGKIASFSETLRNGKSRGYLSLSADEVNALLNNYKGFEKQGGGIRISFEDDQIKGEVSFPLAGLPLGFGEGRFLNGSATFKVWAEGGLLIVTMDSLEVRGKKVPEFIMSKIRKTNLAKDLYKDVEKAMMLKRMKRVDVREGNLIIEVEPK